MKHLTMLAVCLMVSVAAFSQQKIERIVKEIEAKGVEGSMVIKRNRENKKVYLRSRVYNFTSKNSNYANQLLKAFKDDAENADESYIKEPVWNDAYYSKNNKLSKGLYRKQNCTLVFFNGDIKTIYILSIKKYQDSDPVVKLEIVMKDLSVSPNKGDKDSYMYIDKYSSIDMDGIDGLLELGDWEGFSKQIGDLAVTIIGTGENSGEWNANVDKDPDANDDK